MGVRQSGAAYRCVFLVLTKLFFLNSAHSTV